VVHTRPLTKDVTEALYTFPGCVDDDEFVALRAYVDDAGAHLRHRGWDNLAHIERFAAAAAMGARVVARFDDDGARRRVVSLLWSLLPVAARVHSADELPAFIAARAPGFRLQPGDVPRIASAYRDFLAPRSSAEPAGGLDALFSPGAGPFLAPRALCPGAARGSCTAVVLEERADLRDHTAASLPPLARGAVWQCAVSREALALDDDVALGAGGSFVRVRVGSDGQPLRTVDGREEPVIVTSDVLLGWLLSAGPDARGLDLRSADDRALLLCWSAALRDVDVDGTSAFSWLENSTAPVGVRARVVAAAIECAVDAVARFALDPLTCRIVLREKDGDGGWTVSAAAALDACALFHDVTPRTPPRELSSLPADSATSPPASTPDASPTRHARDIVWLDAFLRPGVAGGRLTPLAAGRAFARLATSVLAPLGVLPLSGFKDGSGAVLLQRIVEQPRDASDNDVHGARLERAPPRLITFNSIREGHGARDELLFGPDGAWAAGRGLAMPDPKGAPRHDVGAMAAWLAFFLEGLS
jgi:hypothetical protein